MKCTIFVCLLVCLARFCEGGALRCLPGLLDTSCTEENKKVETQEASSSESTESQCLVGTEWESNCHNCRCSDKGYAECTRLENCDKASFGEPSLCKPNTRFQRDCNMCLCLDNGLGLCTLQHCSKSNRTKDTLELSDVSENEKESTIESETHVLLVPKPTLSRKVRAFTTEMPKACQPGQEFRMDCNNCLCDDKGHDFSCTRNDCSATNNNHETRRKRDAPISRVSDPIEMKCVAGSVFDRDCNVCRCTADGNHATCTIKRCKQDNELDSEVHTTESDAGFRCNAGEQFKRDCNDCTCSADGKSVFCTLRLCDETMVSDI